MRVLLFSLALALLLCGAAAAAERPPNIVILFADDLGYADLGSYGNPYIRTPNLDDLAREGQRWTDFYMAAPVCSPSRGALMTGRVPVRTGLYGEHLDVMHPEDTHGMPAEEQTLAEMLQTAGYATGMFGKWHLGDAEAFWPTRHGFDYWYGMPYSNDMDRVGDLPMARKIELIKLGRSEEVFAEFRKTVAMFQEPRTEWWNVPLLRSLRTEGGYEESIVERPLDQNTITRRLTEEAIAFMRAHADRPFFVYVPYSMPHLPLFSSESFAGRSLRGRYGDAVEELDWSAGQIRKALDALGISDNTLLLFTSDNGPWQRVSIEQAGSAGMLRGAKGTTWEGGVRVPAIFWGPGIVRAATVSELGSALDMVATAAALAGLKEHPGVDGYDLSPLLRQTGAAPRDVMPYFARGKLRALRKGQYKLHLLAADSGEPLEKPRLYDLHADLSEQNDIAAANPGKLNELLAEAAALRDSIPVREPIFDRRLH